MIRLNLCVEGIPAILWGKETGKMVVAVHGNMSNKADEPIVLLAEAAIPSGYQVLSFDLPQHGDRKEEPTLCKVQNCVHDLGTIMNYVRRGTKDVSLFACSMGAYFSLLAYQDVGLRQCLFLSPVVCFLQSKNACFCRERTNAPGPAFLLLATCHNRMANPVAWTVKNNEMTVVH